MKSVAKGQVVTLASGGPKMTVKDIVDKRYDSSNRTPVSQQVCTVTCIWFADGEVEEQDFDIEVLVQG